MTNFPNTPPFDSLQGGDANPVGAPFAGPTESGKGQMFIVSNRAAAQASFSAGSYVSAFSAVDLEVWINVFVLPTAGNAAFLDARIQNPGNTTTATCYRWVYVPGSGFAWFILTAGHTFTGPIGGSFFTPHTLGPGEQLGVGVIGNVISGYYGAAGIFTLVDSRVDNTITGAGTFGFGGDDTTVRFINIGGGQVNPALREVSALTAVRTASTW